MHHRFRCFAPILFLLLLFGLAAAPTVAATTAYADASAPFPGSCGDVPPIILNALPNCGTIIPFLRAPITSGDGYWRGVCEIDVYNAEGVTGDNYSFLWIGITSFPSPSLARPNACECNKVSQAISRCHIEPHCQPNVEGSCDTSPVVINPTGPIKGGPGPMNFDIDADGTVDRITWVENGTVFFALDRNGDGVINDGSELFGTATPGNTGLPGYKAFAAYDTDNDGWVTRDELPALLLWSGSAGAGQTHSAWDTVSAVGVAYSDGHRVDEWGNRYAWRGWILMKDGSRRPSVDILFKRRH
jgi:hypothetical protein